MRSEDDDEEDDTTTLTLYRQNINGWRLLATMNISSPSWYIHGDSFDSLQLFVVV